MWRPARPPRRVAFGPGQPLTQRGDEPLQLHQRRQVRSRDPSADHHPAAVADPACLHRESDAGDIVTGVQSASVGHPYRADAALDQNPEIRVLGRQAVSHQVCRGRRDRRDSRWRPGRRGSTPGGFAAGRGRATEAASPWRAEASADSSSAAGIVVGGARESHPPFGDHPEIDSLAPADGARRPPDRRQT